MSKRGNMGWRISLLIVACLVDISHAQLVVTNAQRELQLISQSNKMSLKMAVKNDGRDKVESVDFCLPQAFIPALSMLEVMYEKDSDQQLLKLSAPQQTREGISCLSAELKDPLKPGKSANLQILGTFTQLQKPFPAKIWQNEAQRVLALDTVHVLVPYTVLKQTTKVTLASADVEDYTQVQPVSKSGNEITYGPYTDVKPFTNVQLRLHFENNTPFAVATSLKREIEVSHWGNVYVEEQYIVRHSGAQIQGEFSRLDLMKNPQVYGRAAIRGFMAVLPSSAHSIYFRDPIGNISTTSVNHGLKNLELVMSPRFPLYGGWQTEFTLGYSLPLGDVVRKGRDSILQLTAMFGSPIMGLVVEHLENRVVLPEGSISKGVSTAFDVNKSLDKKFTYLDTHGRPVVVLQRDNIGQEHNVLFLVFYTFSSLSLLQEPLLLIGAFALAFAVVIAYNRCNFRITKDAKWAAENRAEKAAHLLSEIGSVVAQRTKAINATSVSDSTDIQALQAKFSASAAKLKSKCKELEALGGAGMVGQVEKYLDEEKVIKARLDRICSTAARSLQNNDSKEATQKKVTSELQQISSDVQQQFDKKIEPLQ